MKDNIALVLLVIPSQKGGNELNLLVLEKKTVISETTSDGILYPLHNTHTRTHARTHTHTHAHTHARTHAHTHAHTQEKKK